MKHHTYLVLAFSLIFVYTSCSKLKEKKMSVTLNEYISQYEGLRSIEEEKLALSAQADKMQPTGEDGLQECAETLAKLSEVYATTMPTLIEQDKAVRTQAITTWKEHNIAEIADAENSADAALKGVEVSASRDLLALKIKANEVAHQRLQTYELMAAALQSQGEDLQARVQNLTPETLTPETQERILADQNSLNQLHNVFQSERQWLEAHPHLEKDQVFQQWRESCSDPAIAEAAYRSYQETYE